MDGVGTLVSQAPSYGFNVGEGNGRLCQHKRFGSRCPGNSAFYERVYRSEFGGSLLLSLLFECWHTGWRFVKVIWAVCYKALSGKLSTCSWPSGWAICLPAIGFRRLQVFLPSRLASTRQPTSQSTRRKGCATLR